MQTTQAQALSNKQEIFLRRESKRLNLLCGAVRSGKTYCSLIAFALFVFDMPASSEFIMIGKTLTTLKRNCLTLMEQLVGPNNFTFSASQKAARLFGRRVWLEGANDERSENKIRGLTLAGAYCDELTLIPKGFYYMLLSRLSVTGARLYATTNPDNPMHWVKKDVIDNEKIQKQLNYIEFTIDDNPYLDARYIEDIKASNAGVFYDRYILGKWVVAEGLVYPMFNRDFHVVPVLPRPYQKYWIAMDYGMSNATAMGLWGLADGVYYCVKEYYHSGRETNQQKTDEDYYTELERLAEIAGHARNDIEVI